MLRANSQIVDPKDGLAVELPANLSKRLLVKTYWLFSREDVDTLNSVQDNYIECTHHINALEEQVRELVALRPQPLHSKPFISTTIGKWTVGVSVTIAVSGAFYLGTKVGD